MFVIGLIVGVVCGMAVAVGAAALVGAPGRERV